MDRRDIRRELRKFRIIAAFSNEELSAVSSSIYLREYHKGQILFNEGDPRDRIYFLMNGYVKFERTDPQATLMYTDYVKPYNMFPYGGMLTDENYHYSAMVINDVRLFYIPTSILEALIIRNTKATRELVRELSRILELHEKRLQTITVSSATKRVIQALHYLASDLGKRKGEKVLIPFNVSTVDLAVLSGTTRETVSHVLKRLKHDHVLSRNNRQIMIHRPEFFR